MTKKIVIILMTTALLSGCTKPEFRECLNKAEYTTNIKKAEYQRRYGSKRIEYVQDTEETKRLKALCRES